MLLRNSMKSLIILNIHVLCVLVDVYSTFIDQELW